MSTALFIIVLVAFVAWVYRQEADGVTRLAKDRFCEAQGFSRYNRTLFDVKEQFLFSHQ